MLKLNEVVKAVTLSKSTIYRLIKAGQFPGPVGLSRGRVAWQSEEIEAWRCARPKSQFGGRA